MDTWNAAVLFPEACPEIVRLSNPQAIPGKAKKAFEVDHVEALTLLTTDSLIMDTSEKLTLSRQGAKVW